MGIYDAREMRTKVAAMLRGAVATCSLMPTPDTNSAANAEVTPNIARRELMVSGAAHDTHHLSGFITRLFMGPHKDIRKHRSKSNISGRTRYLKKDKEPTNNSGHL